MPTVESDGLEIYYEVHGSGPPLILLHSFLCSGEMWREQLEPLASHFRVVNVDLRGHGRSQTLDREPDLYALVEDAIAVLDALEIERATWMGLSIVRCPGSSRSRGRAGAGARSGGAPDVRRHHPS